MSDLGLAVVIEDDADVRNILEALFREWGFGVYSAPDGKSGVEVVRRHNADMVTLDIGLPDIDGFEVLRRIRKFSDAYVVMLTGRDDEADILTALYSGADEYITKPFRPRELRARLTAVMRRPRHAPPSETLSAPSPAHWPSSAFGNGSFITHNGLTLNPQTRTVLVDGTTLVLTPSEFDLLHELLEATGGVRTRADLVLALRGERNRHDIYVSESAERAVADHIGNLRRKLRDDPQSPRWLDTVRGVGYRLAPVQPPVPDEQT
ncbi:response regulator transcription factor [Arthrobacter globiformis]|uniref:DNA-binding response regulator n=1 Tax=Arthrobacter globiformis TaxID=1665 RepID=A0A328HE56_ARTGO|nr:response regulator transcription factor [Arthrobacter globiformis]RAM36792.1 DNA-binding response regulator [Arthrobacter globiformis]